MIQIRLELDFFIYRSWSKILRRIPDPNQHHFLTTGNGPTVLKILLFDNSLPVEYGRASTVK